MNIANHGAELELVRLLAGNKDFKLLSQIEQKWFDNTYCNHAIEIWKQSRSFDYLTFSKYALDGNYNIPKLEIQCMYEQPHIYSEFDAAVAVVRSKHQQRELNAKLIEISQKVFNSDPAELELELIQYFKDQEYRELENHRKITDGLQQDNPGLLTIGGTIRPMFDEIVPLRKTLLTLVADSGHHKTNQVIDLLILNIINNPTEKSLFFSKEMDFDEVQARIYSKLLSIPLKPIMRRKYPDGTKIDVDVLSKRIESEFPNIVSNLIVIDPQEFKVNSDIGRLIIKHNPSLWALDYLQYYAQEQAGNAAEQNRNVMEAAAFCKNIAQITNSFGIPLSQVKKRSEFRLSLFPRIDDMEWSGLTKQISHSIGMCFWPYKHDDKAMKNYYCISYQKVRNGDLFTEEIEVFPETCSFKYPFDKTLLSHQERQQILNYYKMTAK
jgi:replicative DNA helicase